MQYNQLDDLATGIGPSDKIRATIRLFTYVFIPESNENGSSSDFNRYRDSICIEVIPSVKVGVLGFLYPHLSTWFINLPQSKSKGRVYPSGAEMRECAGDGCMGGHFTERTERGICHGAN